MDKEFHFYITYIIAQRAGFSDEDSYKIAYASQYTDDNTVRYSISGGDPDPFETYMWTRFAATRGQISCCLHSWYIASGSGCQFGTQKACWHEEEGLTVCRGCRGIQKYMEAMYE